MKALIAATLTLSGMALIPMAAKASGYCSHSRSGSYVCLHNVYSYRGTSVKQIVISLDGSRPRSFHIDCGSPQWEYGSILDVACSQYRAASY